MVSNESRISTKEVIMKNLEGRPKKVLEVIRESVRGNPEAVRHHRAMSRKGGEAAAESKRLKKENAEIHAAQLMEEATHVESETRKTLYSLSPEGDILPPDEQE